MTEKQKFFFTKLIVSLLNIIKYNKYVITERLSKKIFFIGTKNKCQSQKKKFSENSLHTTFIETENNITRKQKL